MKKLGPNAALTCLLGLFISITPSAFARWAGIEDAAVAIEFSNHEITVHDDGSYTDITDKQTEILKDSARTGYGTFRQNYNPKAGSIKVLTAETIVGKEKFSVDSKFIEDKPTASNGHGFEQTNQFLIAFPNIQVGSKIHLQSKQEIEHPPIKGVYTALFSFDRYALYKGMEISIDSELPLHVQVNDPRKNLQVGQIDKEGHHFLKVRLAREFTENVLDEKNPLLNMNDATWVAISTAKDFAEFVQPVFGKYEKVLSASLPPLFQSIAEKASAKPTPVEKINVITSSLATSMRYMGDWRPVDGGHFPRPLDTIADTRFGDCKDFSASTAAILRHLGFTADIAWVQRGELPAQAPALPIDAVFNHAIVKAGYGGQTFWIDPTNRESFAQGIFPDIAGRPALVISKDTTQLSEIPMGTPKDSGSKRLLEVAFDSNGDASTHYQQHLQGRYALMAAGATLSVSKETFDRYLVSSFAKEAQIKSMKVADYDLSDRIVSDLDFSADVTESNVAYKTSVGLAYRLPSPHLAEEVVDLETTKRVSDLFVQGSPATVENEMRLNNIQVVGSKLVGCSVTSPWFSMSRVYKGAPNALVVRDRYETTVARVPNADLKSEQFTSLQKKLKDCFEVSVIFKPVQKKEIKKRALAGDK